MLSKNLNFLMKQAYLHKILENPTIISKDY